MNLSGDACTVCGDAAYSAALCKAHYHVKYKSIIEWIKQDRQEIARRFRSIRAALALADLYDHELNGLAYIAAPKDRLIIALTPRSEMKKAVEFARNYRSKLEKLKGDM